MEKAKTVSRSVTQQRTVEQIVSSPAAKVVEPVPKMMVQLVDVPQTVSRGRIQQRADERMDDPLVPKVLQELVEKGIAERFVVQSADVTDCPADPGQASTSSMRWGLTFAKKLWR